MEPALYTFDPPRTIAATLNEYERHLGELGGDGSHSIQAALAELRDLLDPIEAPLVALTAGMVRTLVASAARELSLSAGETCHSLFRPIQTAWRFFGWAKERGYIGHNPFDSAMRGPTSTAQPVLASRRSVGCAARGWVA